MTNYYLHRDGQSHGPYPEDHMIQLIASGRVAGDEQICEEGGSTWVAASTLGMAGPPQPAAAAEVPSIQKPASNGMVVTAEQVAAAYQRVKAPILGITFSIFFPVILLAAKSDAERGVGSSGRHRALKELAKENTDYLPLAVVVGIIGATCCIIWFMKTLKKAKKLKAQLAKQQVG